MCTLNHLFTFLPCLRLHIGGCWCRAAAYIWYRAHSNLPKKCVDFIFFLPGSFSSAVAAGSLNRATGMLLLPKGSKSTLKSRENVAIMLLKYGFTPALCTFVVSTCRKFHMCPILWGNGARAGQGCCIFHLVSCMGEICPNWGNFQI